MVVVRARESLMKSRSESGVHISARNDSAAPTLPVSTAAPVAVVVSIVGVVIIGIVAWKVIARRRRRTHSELSPVESGSASSAKRLEAPGIQEVEEPRPIYHLRPPEPFEHGGWRPQIRTFRGETPSDPEKYIVKRPLPPSPSTQSDSPCSTAAEDASDEKSPSKPKRTLSWKKKKLKDVEWEMARTPPPAYIVANGGVPSTPQTVVLPTPPPAFHTLTPRPNFVLETPSSALTPAGASASAPAAESSESQYLTVPGQLKHRGREEDENDGTPPPLPSPARLQSFQHTQHRHGSSSSRSPSGSRSKPSHSPSSSSLASDNSPSKHPRLMSVTNTFTPQMDDELRVYIGELLRLLEEFGDGWCLVQRVGKVDAQKGVVPRACLSERPSVAPGSSPTKEILKGGFPRQVSTTSFGWR